MSTYANRMEGMSGNVIREILKLTQQSDVISFAGGLPSPESFPVDALRDLAAACMAQDPVSILQYATSEGYPPLREFLAEWVGRFGIHAVPDDILVLTGSQQGIDLACKAILNAGDVVLVEEPTYLAALQIFQLYEAKVVPVPGDSEGMDMEALDQAIRLHKPKMIYLVPTFRNPSGETWSRERRAGAAKLAGAAGVIIVEDDPYGALRYDGEDLPAVKGYDESGHAVYLGSFSKIVSPGLRVGYAVAPPEIRRRMLIGKQSTDVHTSNFSQRVVADFCRSGHLTRHIDAVRRIYGAKRDCMLEALAAEFPNDAEWTRPQGGLFIWARLDPSISTERLLPVSVERERVAFIPGTPFYVDGSGGNTMRLNFSNADPESIREGIKRLGRVIKSADPAIVGV